MVDPPLLRDTVLGRTPPVSIEQVGAHVFKVTLVDGLQAAFKQFPEAPAPDPLSTEAAVLRRLHGLGCPVPEVYLVETSARILVTAWAGDRTMDDLCQEDDREAVGRCGGEIAEGLCQIEATSDWKAEPLRALTLNPDAEDEADGIHRNARAALNVLLRRDDGSMKRARENLEQVMAGVRQGTRSVASLDYNARNAVTDASGKARFIDFSAVGWDWPERRFVQYVTGLGACRAGGRLVSPLTPELVNRYVRARSAASPGADGEAVARAVDAHDLLFHLLVLARLLRAEDNPEAVESRLLRRVWDGPKDRRRQAILNLGRPLSDAPGVNALREMFRGRGDP